MEKRPIHRLGEGKPKMSPEQPACQKVSECSKMKGRGHVKGTQEPNLKRLPTAKTI